MVAPFSPATAPQGTWRLIEQSFFLWWASWRANFVYGLLYGVASLLPALTLGELSTQMLRVSLSLGADVFLPWLPAALRGDPVTLLDAVGIWLRSPLTWLLMTLSLLGVLASLNLIIASQARIAHIGAERKALARLPAGIGAWLVYLVVCMALCLPIIAVAWFVFSLTVDVDLTGLMILLLGFLFGSALAAVPLVWASVALGFAPFASMIDGDGAFAAQRRSAQRVRGRWVHSALVLSVPLFAYLGVSSTLSSFAMAVVGGLTFALGGWMALFDGGWLLWSQLVAALATAAAVPLATAGGVLGWHDLGLRAKT